MERVADYIIKRIHEVGVEHIFLVTGRGILFLTDAVAKEGIKHVSTYHEQGASYAAMAYAQSKDNVGACLVSTGCAATNAITAALCAWQDNIPVIFISGQHMLKETTRYTQLPIRTYGSQEADIISMVESITKYSVMLTDSNRVAYEMDKAIHLATTGRKGPVWIDIPLDVQNMRIEPSELQRFIPDEKCIKLLDDDVSSIVNNLNNSEYPLLLIGGGIRSAGAMYEVAELVNKIGIPVVFTPAAADCYGSKNDLSIGAIGSIGGSRAGNFAIQNADYILAVGTKLCSQITSTDFDKFAPNAKIDIVDIDSLEHTKSEVSYKVFINADAKCFMDLLLTKELRSVNKYWIDKCKHWKQIFSISNEDFVKEANANNEIDLYSFSEMLNKYLSNDATIITDAGLEELIIPSAIKYGANQRCLFPAAQGAMGYAIPAILGAYYAGRKDIVAVVGDGSIMMNIQELGIISSSKIPVKIFIINNNMYAVIRKRQKDLFRKRTIGNDPSDGVPSLDFSTLASAFGFRYTKISEYRNLSNTIENVMGIDGSMICEVMCVEDQKYLHKSYRINSKRRLEYCPLNDLSPFLDSDIIEKEMMYVYGKGESDGTV